MGSRLAGRRRRWRRREGGGDGEQINTLVGGACWALLSRMAEEKFGVLHSLFPEVERIARPFSYLRRRRRQRRRPSSSSSSSLWNGRSC